MLPQLRQKDENHSARIFPKNGLRRSRVLPYVKPFDSNEGLTKKKTPQRGAFSKSKSNQKNYSAGFSPPTLGSATLGAGIPVGFLGALIFISIFFIGVAGDGPLIFAPGFAGADFSADAV